MEWQGSLLEQDVEPQLGRLACERTTLDGGAWVDVSRGWLRGADRLLELLLRRVPWMSEKRVMYESVLDVPRLTRFYGAGQELPHPVLAHARDTLTGHYASELGEPFTTAGMCLYRDGADSVAWHGDRVGRGRDVDTLVAIVSLGATRPLMLRPRDGGPSVPFPTGHGDLIVMGGSCQRTWDHCIPKTRRPVGPRVSIQFRPQGVR